MNKEQENFLKERLKKKVRVEGPDWFHDPSGEELEFIYEDEEEDSEEKPNEYNQAIT